MMIRGRRSRRRREVTVTNFEVLSRQFPVNPRRTMRNLSVESRSAGKVTYFQMSGLY
jgi:hypothetical protein